MPELYPYGYAGARLTLEQIAAKPGVQAMDPEFRRRVFAMMQVARKQGVSLGIGGAGRTTAGQRALFLKRHQQVRVGRACCRFEGKRWQLRKGMAHAAPPGLSYHEPTTPPGGVLAADMIGNLRWMAGHCAEFGLREFSKVNNEPWHVQPVDVPGSRSGYSATKHHPLKVIALPDDLAAPTLRRGDEGPAVARLQDLLRAHGHNPGASDGKYGPRTEAAVRALQLAVGLPVDGTVGPNTWEALR